MTEKYNLFKAAQKSEKLYLEIVKQGQKDDDSVEFKMLQNETNQKYELHREYRTL